MKDCVFQERRNCHSCHLEDSSSRFPRLWQEDLWPRTRNWVSGTSLIPNLSELWQGQGQGTSNDWAYQFLTLFMDGISCNLSGRWSKSLTRCASRTGNSSTNQSLSIAQRMSYLQEIDLLVVKFPVTVQTLVIISMWSLGRCLGSNYQTVPSAVGKQKSVGIEWNDGSSPSIPYSLAKSSCTQKNQVRLSVNQLRCFRKTFDSNCGIEWTWVICWIE